MKTVITTKAAYKHLHQNKKQRVKTAEQSTPKINQHLACLPPAQLSFLLCLLLQPMLAYNSRQFGLSLQSTGILNMCCHPCPAQYDPLVPETVR